MGPDRSANAIVGCVKILVVHEIDYVNKPFFEFQEFAEGLSVRGHEVSVLHVQEFERKAAPKLDSFAEVSGLQVPDSKIRLYSTKFVARGIFSRVLASFEHVRILLRIFALNRPDVVLSYSVPTSGVTVALLGKMLRVPVVHRAIDVSHLLRSRVLSALVRLSEILTFTLSTSVSTHNYTLMSYVQKTTREKKMVSIDYPPVYPIDVPDKRQTKQPVWALRLIFIGTLAHFTDLENVLHSMASQPIDSKINLRIVGSGPRENELKRISQTLGLDDRVEFRGWKERKDFTEELAWADIGIVPFKKSLLTDCALPQKAIEYLSAGLSVVSTRLDGAESVLGEFKGMHFVESSAQILETCRELASSGALEVFDRDLVRDKFSRESTVEGIEKLLIEAVGFEDK